MKKPEKDKKQTREEFDTKLDVLRYLTLVQSRINEDITSDAVLAKLTEKDKELIIETTNNAYTAIRLIAYTSLKAKNKEDSKKIMEYADQMFDIFMNRCYMTMIMNRNVEGNYILNILGGVKTPEEENTEEEIISIEKVKEKIKENNQKA